MTPLRLTIEGIPRSGKNSQRIAVNRRTGKRFTLKSKAATAWATSAFAQLVAQRGRRKLIIGPCAVDLMIYQRADVCDVDNVASLVLDSLNGVIIGDDSDVVDLRARKAIDRERPRVEIIVQEVAA